MPASLRGRVAFYAMLASGLATAIFVGVGFVTVGGAGVPLEAGAIVTAEASALLEQAVYLLAGLLVLTVFLPLALVVLFRHRRATARHHA